MRIYEIQEVLKKKNTNTTDKGRKQIIERMLNKTSDKNMKGYSHYNNQYAFLDGHRVFLSHTTLGVEESEHPFNIDPLFKVDLEEEIIIPREYVEYFAKKKKDGWFYKPMVIEKDGFFVAFNASFVLDAIRFSNSEKFYFSKRHYTTKQVDNFLISPLFQKDEKGEIITVTLPVNIKNGIDDYERSLNYIEIE